MSFTRQGPSNATPDQLQAALQDLCVTATAMANNEVGQTLRATVDLETLQAPSHRVGIEPNGWARFVTSLFPVLKVVQCQVAYGGPRTPAAGGVAAFNYTTVPAGMAFPEQAPFGVLGSSAPGGATGGMNAIMIAGGFVNWGRGRMGTRISMLYVNGWPHTSITETVDAGVTVLPVDDVTGWFNSADAVGATGRIFNQESSEIVHVIGATPNTAPTDINPEPHGPGTLTLAGPTTFAHTVGPAHGPIVTALPTTVRDATMLFAAAQGLRNGMATMTAPSLPGAATSSGTGGVQGAIKFLEEQAAWNLRSFKRTY